MYYISNSTDILKILQSRTINLYINEYLYKNIPKVGKEDIIIKFNLLPEEKYKLNKIDKNTFTLDKTISLEHRDCKIICFSVEQHETLLKYPILYREIKNVDENSIVLSELIESDFEKIDNSKVVLNDIILDYDRAQSLKFDKLKGAIYMLLIYYPNLGSELINKYSKVNEELILFEKIISNIRSKNLFDFKLYNSSRSFKNMLEKKVSQEIEVVLQKNVIFEIDDNYNFRLNHDLFKLEKTEILLLNNIIDYTLNKCNSVNKEDINNVILSLYYTVLNNEDLKVYEDDIDILLKRVIKQDYTQNIGDIESDFIKNIFAFTSNYNNVNDLHYFLKDMDIKNNYWTYTLYGLFFGYSNLTNSIVNDVYLSGLNEKVLKKTIYYLEYTMFNLNSNMQHTRDRIHFTISSLLTNYENSILPEVDNIMIIKKTRGIVDIIKLTDGNDSMIIEYCKREGSIAKSISYFDNKTQRINSMLIASKRLNNDHMFSYYFIENKKEKALDLRLEKKYMIFLSHIYKSLLSREGK